jgi:hypothetical protein
VEFEVNPSGSPNVRMDEGCTSTMPSCEVTGWANHAEVGQVATGVTP